MTTEALPGAAGAEHLTGALRRAGALADGRVCGVAVESSRHTVLSRIIRLRLTYEGASAGAPSSIVLKTGLPERIGGDWSGGRQEVAFYTQVAPAMPARVVPRCFEAVWHADTNDWHLLLEDLTESHVVATAWPVPPTTGQCESIVGAMARFHAAWWDDPRLGVSVGTWLDSGAMDGQVERFAEKYAQFSERVGDRLPPERRKLFERLIDAGPRLSQRYHSHRNLTILHGDSHVWNVFLPKTGASDDVRVFDWWRVDVGTDDLAYMMALHWYPDLRREFERPLLDHYHAELMAHGVTGYDRRALDDDYRLSALWHITTPVWQEVNKIPPWIWWNNLGRTFLAVDDLDCREFLS
jgi:hypothetical protein